MKIHFKKTRIKNIKRNMMRRLMNMNLKIIPKKEIKRNLMRKKRSTSKEIKNKEKTTLHGKPRDFSAKLNSN